MVTYAIVGQYQSSAEKKAFSGHLKKDDSAFLEGMIDGRSVRGIIEEETLLLAENIGDATAIFRLQKKEEHYEGQRVVLPHKMRLSPDIGLLLGAIDPTEYESVSVQATLEMLQ